MANSTTVQQKDGYRTFVGWVLTAVGALMMIGAVIAWITIGSQLSAQKMTVPDDSPSNAGRAVAGPLTAWSMQEIIQHHANKISDGQTYAELGKVVNEAKEKYGDDSKEAADAQGLRNTQMNAAFLRASLFTSVLSYGVALLALGTGFSVLLAGTAFLKKPNEYNLNVSTEELIETEN